MSADLALSDAGHIVGPDVRLPTTRDEAWRYAPHRTLAELAFGPSSGLVASIPEALLDDLPEFDGARVVVVNGVVDNDRSTFEAAGVTVRSMAAADARADRAAGDPEASSPADAYAVLNEAFGADGVLVEIAPGVTVEQPVHIIDITVPDHLGGATCTRNRVHLGAESSATIVETRIGANTGFGGSNVSTLVSLDADATLEHVVVQDLADAQVHLGRVEIDQAAGSSFAARSFNTGAAYGRLEYHVRLDGPGATADLAGLYLGTGEQVLDQQITVVHAAENCVSRQAFRGVLDDRSSGVFNGGIDVRPGADGTDASQSNDNLLLSERAEANTQPRLEILADEVTCAHGATVGRLDEQALYYLRSRGIPTVQARRLLIDAFTDRVIEQVRSEPVRAWITRRLGHGDHG